MIIIRKKKSEFLQKEINYLITQIIFPQYQWILYYSQPPGAPYYKSNITTYGSGKIAISNGTLYLN